MLRVTQSTCPVTPEIGMYDYSVMEDKLPEVLFLLGALLSEAELEEVQHFIDVGEYGLAFETLCVIIDEEQKMIPPNVDYLIADLGKRMEFDPAIWERFKKSAQDENKEFAEPTRGKLKP